MANYSVKKTDTNTVQAPSIRKVSMSDESDAASERQKPRHSLIAVPSAPTVPQAPLTGLPYIAKCRPTLSGSNASNEGTDAVALQQNDQKLPKTRPVESISKAAIGTKFSPCRNFIVIDSDGDDEECDGDCFITAVKPARAAPTSVPGRKRTNIGAPVANSHERRTRMKSMPPQSKNHPDAFDWSRSHEAAAEEQDRLFRECAARMRTKVAGDPNFLKKKHHSVITVPVVLVHKHYPEHWQWRDPYARLGLPRNSSATLVKCHYRKLAKVYHPDKRRAGDSTAPFHAISAAYHKLTHTMPNCA